MRPKVSRHCVLQDIDSILQDVSLSDSSLLCCNLFEEINGKVRLTVLYYAAILRLSSSEAITTKIKLCQCDIRIVKLVDFSYR
jgi:hypothetical protein